MTDEEWADLQKQAEDAKNAFSGGEFFDKEELDRLKDEFERVSNLKSSTPPSEKAVEKAEELYDAMVFQMLSSGDVKEFLNAGTLARTKNFTLKLLARHYETELREENKNE